MQRYRLLVVILVAACFAIGCNQNPTPPIPQKTLPIATGKLVSVTIWQKPVQRAGEIGQNRGASPDPGSKVEIYENFIIVTPSKGPSILSLHGWYTNLEFDRE